MSNSIWKTGNLQKADTRKQILFFAGGGRFPYYGRSCPKQGVIGSWVYDDVQKWCYVDDLIAQADKAERLQKAVDLALERFDDIRRLYDKYYDKYSVIATETTEEIKQLIKGE